MERQFDIQLERLRNKILKMCSLVEEQVDFAIRAIEDNDSEQANLVIERDKKVDKLEINIDRICQKIIALNHPVAMDLPLIISALTISKNIERIGGIAVDIAGKTAVLQSKRVLIGNSKFLEMAKFIKEMLRNSRESFIQHDPKLAQKVLEADKTIDKYNADNHNVLIKLMKEDPRNIEAGVALIDLARQLERIGDHAVNIAEDVLFIVEAQTIKNKYEKYLFGEDDDDADEELLS